MLLLCEFVVIINIFCHSEKQLTSIHTKFTKDRSTLPLMFIATPYDKFTSLWTKGKPTAQIVQRMALLARESLTLLTTQLVDTNINLDFKVCTVNGLVSHSPLKLATRVRIPVGTWLGSLNVWMRGEEITSCKSRIESVGLNDWCIMIFLFFFLNNKTKNTQNTAWNFWRNIYYCLMNSFDSLIDCLILFVYYIVNDSIQMKIATYIIQ